MIKKILFFLVLLNVSFGFSLGFQWSQETKVSVITIGVANESHTFYGHTGLRFTDNSQAVDMVFNFGYFDFNTENFLLKFVKGDLQYFVAAQRYADFEYAYKMENRSIYEQELALNLEEKKQLFELINKTLYSEERFYTYKFIDRNCTTMVIDKINEIMGTKVIKFQEKQKVTYREVLFPYTNNHFYQQLGINLIFGTKVDQEASKLFLPLDLKKELQKIKYNEKPLVIKETTVFEAQKVEDFSYWDSIYSLIAVMLILIMSNNKTLDLIYFIILGLLGILFCLVGFYSLHEEVLWNYNALLINPFYLLLVVFMWKKNTKKINQVKSFLAFTLLIYALYMINKAHLTSVAPIIMANAILLYRTNKILKFK
ncbi:lipoprotein N-acyltransferase Lnb domain-containing protein [Flavobacterium sp.]|uniref:lipoprotein N-acyltransferase Lnb domain-containing protein n=1 Tax=Flavobacterium sp. TaxID=239 RepID=UPI003F69B81D